MIITISNEKGGVAKTTTAANLGFGLSDKGYKVLLIDLDPQHNLSMICGVEEEDFNSSNLITQDKNPKSLIINLEGLDLIPASSFLSVAEEQLNSLGREYKLKESIEKIKDEYDFILIDTSPSLGVLTINALTAADRVLIPVQADFLSCQALQSISETIDTVRNYTNSNLKIDGVLITRYNQRTNLAKDIREMIEKIADKTLSTKVYKTPIRESTIIKESQVANKPVFEYDKRAKVSEDYQVLVDDFLEGLENE